MPNRDVQAAVIYYSATGTTYQMAQAAVEGAEKAGAEVRLRRVAELAPPEAIKSNEQWQEHAKETAGLPEATMDDLEWADAVVFGTPTRFGNVSAQLKQYIDQAGPLWEAGKLLNKVFAGFCSTATSHGGQESTLLSLFNVVHHWGGVVVTPGYATEEQFEAGNPYGASHTSANGEVPPGDVQLQATELTARRAVQVAGALLRADLLPA